MIKMYAVMFEQESGDDVCVSLNEHGEVLEIYENRSSAYVACIHWMSETGKEDYYVQEIDFEKI